MTTPLRQFILKRGNTTVSSTYTGPLGEITFDTGLHALRIHDGITPGGELMPSNTLITTIESNITLLQSNTVSQQESIDYLRSVAPSSGVNPPDGANEGKVWYDSISGRLYVYYDGFWVDASPESIYSLPVATAEDLGGVIIGDNITIDGNGRISVATAAINVSDLNNDLNFVSSGADISVFNNDVGYLTTATLPNTLGNLTVIDQTIFGNNPDQNIVLAPIGAGSTVIDGNLAINSGYNFKIGQATVQSTDNTFRLDSNLVPSLNDTISLGRTDLRWKSVWIGPGSIYITDEITGGDVEITARNGNVTLVGGSGLDVGEFTFFGNTIALKSPTEEIQVGTQFASGNVVFNRPIKVVTSAGGETFGVTRDGQVLIKSSYQNPNRYSTLTIVGNDAGIFEPPVNSGGMLHIVGHDGVTSRVNNDSFGPANTVYSHYVGRTAEGTAANPLPTTPSLMTRFGGTPYIGGGYAWGPPGSIPSVYIDFVNDANPASITNRAAHLAIYTTKPNTYVAAKVLTINNDGLDFYESTSRLSFGNLNTISANTIANVIAVSSGGFAVYDPTNSFFAMQVDPADGQTFFRANVTPTVGNAVVTISANPSQTVIPLNATVGGVLHLTGGVSGSTLLTIDSSNNDGNSNAGRLQFRRNRGTVDAPSSVLINDWLGAVTGFGYTPIGMPSSPAARMSFVATENFGLAGQGTKIDFAVTANGQTNSTTILTLDSNGSKPGLALPKSGTGIQFPDGTFQTTAASVLAINAGYAISVTKSGTTVGIDNIGVASIAGTANQVLVNGGTAAANAAITLSLPQSIGTTSSPTFANITVTGNLNVQGNIISSNDVALDSKIIYLANLATSADQIDGGGIILGNVNAAFKRSITYDLDNDRWSTDGAGLETLKLDATDVQVYGNFFANGTAHFGGQNEGTDYPNSDIQIDANRNDYSQVLYQNHSPGTNASTDFVAANDTGGDSINYIDIGINSSTYNNEDYSIGGPNDGYLYNNGGDLSIGTQTDGRVIRFHTSGTTAANLRVTIDDNGLTSVGNVSATYFVGSAKYLTDTYGNLNVQLYLPTDGTIIGLVSNAGSQQTEINSLRANITAANSAIDGLTANLGAFQTYANSRAQTLSSNIGAFQTWSNANVSSLQNQIIGANTNIQTISANIGAFHTWSNANVSSLQNQITGANNAIITANSAVVSYVNTLNTAMIANVSAANSAIITANTGMKSYVDTQIIKAGAYGDSNVAAYLPSDPTIIGIKANIAYSNVAISAANTAAVSYINSQISSINSAWQSNAAFQEDEISSLRANITAANTSIVGSTYSNANVAAYLPYNTTIQAINANVTAANAAISALQNAGYATLAQLNANVSAANSAIVTANTGMKSYVDSQITTVSLAWAGNAAVQENEISGLRANIIAANTNIQTISANLGSFQTWANGNFGTSTYSNANVAGYLTTYTGNLSAGNVTVSGNITINGTITSTTTSNIQLGNIRIIDQTISGTIYGRDVNIFVNNNGAQAGGAHIVFNSNLMPSRNYVYTLGAKDRRWAKSYHGPKSIDIDGITIETDTDIGGSNIYIGNASILNVPSITSNSVMVATGNITGGNLVSVSSAYFYGKTTTGYDAVYAGVQNGYTALPYDVAQFTGNGNTYIQVNFQNISNGNNATTDFIATTNDGTDTTYYVDLGIAGNTYANSTPNNSLGTSLWPRDAYLYAQGNTAANIGGNLVIGTTTPTKVVKLIAGGVNATNVVATVSNTGVVVAGNVNANYYLGDGSLLSNLPGSFGASVLSGKLTVNPASVSKNNDAIQTFTITGLTTNHKIVITPATALTYGIFISAAWASASNTLSVQFMNLSGGSIDLGNIDINYLAWV